MYTYRGKYPPPESHKPKLDSVLACFENQRILYLGDPKIAHRFLKRYFPDKFSKMLILSQSELNRQSHLRAKYPKLIGKIDIDDNYGYTKLS